MSRSPAVEEDLRVVVVGDDLVAGRGDAKALGWVGRVAARTPASAGFTAFALGVPGEGTAELVTRWREEAPRRWVGGAPRLVLGLGTADIAAGTSLARSRLNLANVLDEAEARGVPAFVVGPPPPSSPTDQERVGELATAFGDVSARRGVPFVDCFGPLVQHEQWYADLASGDGVHPGQAGYGLLAWLVLHGGWYAWLGLPQP